MPNPPLSHPKPASPTGLHRDDIILLLADALLPDWAGIERLLDRVEGREVAR